MLITQSYKSWDHQDKIQVETKERDEIDAKIIACDGKLRKRKLLQEYSHKIKEIEAETIDVNDNGVLENIRKARENAPKRIKWVFLSWDSILEF